MSKYFQRYNGGSGNTFKSLTSSTLISSTGDGIKHASGMQKGNRM